MLTAVTKLKDTCSLEEKLWPTLTVYYKAGTLLKKVHIVKAMIFPIVMYGCESWNIKKSVHWRIDTSELWCWRRLLRVPWTARSNESILKETNPEYSLEVLMLKLKLQYFGHLIRKADLLKRPQCWERLKAGGEKGMTENEMVGWHHLLNGHEFEQAPGVGDE